VAANAAVALEALTGLRLGVRPERWRAWHASESAWWRERAPRALADLEHAKKGVVFGALNELAARRLHRDVLAERVQGVLGHADPSIRRLACTILAGLGDPRSGPALVECLADADDGVAHAAWDALKALTGLVLPLDGAAWAQALAL
jgi:hypothetical protein